MGRTGQQQTFIRFLRYVKPYWFDIVLGAIGGIVKFTVPLLVPLLTKHLIDNIFQNPALSTQGKISRVTLSISLMAVIFIVFWAPFTYVRHYYTGIAGHRSVFDLRCDLYYHILRMSNSFFNRNQSGGIVSRLISDISQAQNLVGSALTNIWIDGSALFVIVFFLLRIDVPTAIVALSTFPLYVFYFKKIGIKMKDNSTSIQQNIEKISGNLQEKIAGNTVIKVFTAERFEEENFNVQSEKLLAVTMKSVVLQSINMVASGIFTNLPPLLVMLVGGFRVINGDLTVGGLVAINLYLAPLYFPLQRFSELNVIFANSLAALDRIFEIMDRKPEIVDLPDAINMPSVNGMVEFENVEFAYNPASTILSNLHLKIQPGTRVALVGKSGSGKSTLVSLIPRLYDVSGGKISIDNINIKTIRLESLRSHIGIVLQDPVLFSGTIRENILYGNPGASEHELLNACTMANALEFIEALPGGLDAEIGERGVTLSGGQKQRLTIARAFLKNPKILILDEATSALDSESEQLIQASLFKLISGRTSFIIAHRLSTIIRSDLILVLDKGKIVESGTHEYLLNKGELYRQFYEKQFILE